MSTVTLSSFDTLRYVRRLRAANVPEAQAEAQAEALQSVLDTALAEYSAQIATKADIALLEAKLEAKIAIARRDTIIWLGGISIAGFGSVIGVFFRLLG